MGNINDSGLPQMKRILRDTTNTKDSEYLPLLQQAAYDVDSKVGTGITVTVTGSSYALTPAPATTSALWNVYAYRAIYLLRLDELHKFSDEMEGLASIRDEVTTMNRAPTMKIKEGLVAEAKTEYNVSLSGFRRNDSTTAAAMEEAAYRE